MHMNFMRSEKHYRTLTRMKNLSYRSTQMSHSRQLLRNICTAGTIAVICATSLVFPKAYGVEDTQAQVSVAQSELDAAEAQMNQVVSDYHAIEADIASMQEQIESTTSLATQAQEAMLQGRSSLATLATSQYRNNDTTTFLSMLLNAESFEDLLKNVTYLEAVMQQKADVIEEQERLTDEYTALLQTLNEQKDAQDAKLSELDEQRASAEAIVAEAQSKLQSAQGEDAKRLEALAAASAALESPASDSFTAVDQSQSISPQWNTENHGAAGGEDLSNNSDDSSPSDDVYTPAPSTPEPTQPPQTQNNSSSNTVEDGTHKSASTILSGGWFSGIASAYGGSSDPTTPNPGVTANGSVCDDNSMGVAVPRSMSGYRSLFGRTIEIKYGGKTVLSTINDSGGMGGGSRSLDLQPGVFKSFGASTCQSWGLRTVTYRVL